MTTGAFVWFVIFGICTSVFFGIALVVTFHGIGDLRDLLRTSKHRKIRA